LRPALRCQRPTIRNGGSAGGAVHCSIADVLGQCQFYAEWAAHAAAADAHWHARAQAALSGPAGCLSAKSPGSRHGHCDCRTASNLNARAVGRADKGGVGFLAQTCTGKRHGSTGIIRLLPCGGRPRRPLPGLPVTVRPRARRWVRRGPAPCNRRPRGRSLACADSSSGGAKAKHRTDGPWLRSGSVKFKLPR
jgi:hypothetical protein